MISKNVSFKLLCLSAVSTMMLERKNDVVIIISFMNHSIFMWIYIQFGSAIWKAKSTILNQIAKSTSFESAF